MGGADCDGQHTVANLHSRKASPLRGDYRALFLLAAAAAGYLAYLAVAMPASLRLTGDCQYVFWAPAPTPSLNPFWLFVYFVLLLLLLAVALGFISWRQNRMLNVIGVAVLVVALLLWADDLADLWEVIQTGRELTGNLPLSDTPCRR